MGPLAALTFLTLGRLPQSFKPERRCVMATSRPALIGQLPAKTPRIVGETEKQAFDRAIHRRVSERAYHLYQASGGGHGKDHLHWLQAQDEVLQRGLDVRESGSWLSISASFPEVDGDGIEVYLEPNRVIVRAEKKESIQDAESRTQGLTQREIFLIQDLNTEIDPTTASAAFRDQKLTLMVKKRYPVTSASAKEPSTRS
jgi:HSP20 family molecular chaperone IbpA